MWWRLIGFIVVLGSLVVSARGLKRLAPPGGVPSLFPQPPFASLPRAVLEPLALGHYRVLEDINYLWLVQQLTFVEGEVPPPPATLQKMALAAGRRLPAIEFMYFFSCYTLAFKWASPAACEPILQQGMRALPQSWGLPMLWGYLQAFHLERPQVGGQFLIEASLRPGGPEYLGVLGRKLVAGEPLRRREHQEKVRALLPQDWLKP